MTQYPTDLTEKTVASYKKKIELQKRERKHSLKLKQFLNDVSKEEVECKKYL